MQDLARFTASHRSEMTGTTGVCLFVLWEPLWPQILSTHQSRLVEVGLREGVKGLEPFLRPLRSRQPLTLTALVA